MFLSAIIHLKALDKGSIPQHAGSALRAEFLKWVAERDAKRAEELHDGDGRRPYTVSELHGTFHGKDGFNQFEKGGNFWFRVTTRQPLAMNHAQNARFDAFGRSRGNSVPIIR